MIVNIFLLSEVALKIWRRCNCNHTQIMCNMPCTSNMVQRDSVALNFENTKIARSFVALTETIH